MKLRRIVAAAMVAALSAVSLAACGSEESADGLIEFNVGFPWAGSAGKTPTLTGPLGYAIAQDIAAPIFEEYGFKLGDQVNFNNGPPVAQAIESGDLEIGVIGDVPATLAKATGLSVDAISIARPTADIWWVTKEGGVSSIDDLAGKKIALQFGSNFEKYGRAVLEEHGLLDKVEIVNLLFSDTLPALQRGEIDATVAPASTAGLWLQNTDFPILSKASEDNPDLLATSVTLVGTKFREEHPDITKAIWEATKAGQEAIEKDHEAFLEWTSEVTGVPVDVLREEQLFLYSDEPADPEGVATVSTTLEWLLANGSTEEGFDVESWVVS